MDVEITLQVNGVDRRLVVDTRTTLLDALRERLGLTGAKKGCDHGQCGACTMLLDGRRVNSCLALAVAHQGADVVTIEGLTPARGLHPPAGVPRPRRLPVRLLHPRPDLLGPGDAGRGPSGLAQCGRRRAARGDGAPARDGAASDDAASDGVVLDDDEIRERMSGNLCRCGAYANIVPAIAEYATAEHARK